MSNHSRGQKNGRAWGELYDQAAFPQNKMTPFGGVVRSHGSHRTEAEWEISEVSVLEANCTGTKVVGCGGEDTISKHGRQGGVLLVELSNPLGVIGVKFRRPGCHHSCICTLE